MEGLFEALVEIAMEIVLEIVGETISIFFENLNFIAEKINLPIKFSGSEEIIKLNILD